MDEVCFSLTDNSVHKGTLSDTFVIHVPRAKANSDRLIVLTGYFTMLSAFLGVSQSFAQHASADFTHDLSLSYKGLKIL